MDEVSRDELVSAARKVAANAHAPYSGFRVGAAVVASDGRVFLGCNVENAAYGSTVCAEVSAITAAVAAGVSDLVAIGVSALDGDDVFPCGNCRQVMCEFNIDTLVVETADGPSVHTLEDVFPHSFGPEHLPGQ